MKQTYEEFERFYERLKTERDELKVKLHLLKEDAKDEWEKTERRWKQLKKNLEKFRSEAEEATRNPDKAMVSLAREIKEKYERIRRHF